jgi:hypothetical protein
MKSLPLILFGLAFGLGGCHPREVSRPNPVQTHQGAPSGDEVHAAFAKGEADRRRNAKVTRRPRRFTGDSL